MYFSLSLSPSVLFDPFIFIFLDRFLKAHSFLPLPSVSLPPPLLSFIFFLFSLPLLPHLPYFNLDLPQALLCWFLLFSFPLQSVPSPARGSASRASPPSSSILGDEYVALLDAEAKAGQWGSANAAHFLHAY